MISHKNKFIFPRITKTASSSIIFVLKQKAGLKGRGHDSAKKLRNKHKKLFNSYFKFAFVRNPWDKVVSFYFYNTKRNWDRYPFSSKTRPDFNKFIKNWYVKGSRRGFHPLSHSPCLDWVSDKNGVIVDYIGRFENLQPDFDFVCDKIGIPSQILPKRNASSRADYKEYFNQESIDIIAKMYKKDIDYFNYDY